MNRTILNRDFQHPADGWYHIEALGEHPNRAANVVQVITPESIASIASRFNSDAAAARLRHGKEMLIDHEHFSDDPQKESRAYGWLYELQNRADGLYGRIRWTVTGQQAVDGGDYRFFSTEYNPEDLKVLNGSQTPRRVTPLRLGGLSLTNMNNNRGQKPITNRVTVRAPESLAAELERETARLVSAYAFSESEARIKAAWITNREVLACAGPKILADHFSNLVNRYKTARSISSFHDAWQQVARMEPALYGQLCATNQK